MLQAPALPNALSSHLGHQGEEEYYQLISMLHDELEDFSLMIVKSDFSPSLRDVLLRQLEQDISPAKVKIVTLSNQEFNIPDMVAHADSQLNGPGILCLIGLEDTPGLVLAPGEDDQRPLAMALLNHGREALRQAKHPLVVWCDISTYNILRSNAPDFWDHYTGIFTFVDTALESTIQGSFSSRTNVSTHQASVEDFDVGTIINNGRMGLSSAFTRRSTSPSAIKFYEEQLAQLKEPTAERAHALIGLAESLLPLPDSDVRRPVERAWEGIEEALSLLSEQDNPAEWARAHALLASLISRYKRNIFQEISEEKFSLLFHASQALKFYTQKSDPIRWAALQWLLGDKYKEWNEEEEDLRQSIEHFQLAERVFSRSANPFVWASIEMNLGDAWDNLPHSNRNKKRAIAHLEAAISAFNQIGSRSESGLAQMILGRVYGQMAENAKDLNPTEKGRLMKRGIASFDAAAKIFAENGNLQNLALARSTAAILLRDLPTGNRRQNLTQAIQYLRQAADILETAQDYEHRALAFSTIGDTLLKLTQITQNTSELIEARQAYIEARQNHIRAGEQTRAQGILRVIQDIDQVIEGIRLEHLAQINSNKTSH